MAVSVPTSVARHRRRTHKHARPRIPWMGIVIAVSFALGVTIAALSDPTTQAILAVFAVGYLVALIIHKGAQHFEVSE